MNKISAAPGKNRELRNKLNIFLRRYFKLLAIVLMALFMYAGYYLFIEHKKAQITDNIRLINENKTEDKRLLEQALADLQEYRRSYDNIGEEDKKRLDAMLPGAESMANLFSNIENMILRRGLILDSVDISVEKKEEVAPAGAEGAVADNAAVIAAAAAEKKAETISLVLTVSGVNSYERMKDFLSAIENNLQLIDIQNIEYDQGAGSLSLGINMYFMK